MRTVAAIFAPLLFPSIAAAECHSGSLEPISVVGWSAEPLDLPDSMGVGGVALTLTLKNQLAHSLRMVDARAHIDDVLGRRIIRVSLEPDLNIAADSEQIHTRRYVTANLSELERLQGANPNDIVVTACTTAVVTGEGEVIRYDE